VTALLSLRSVGLLQGAPEGCEPQAFDPAIDGDALTWLGFETGDPDEPLLAWPRPQRWPVSRRRTSGRHRAPVWLRTA
jgi:hypothetical protein